MAEKSLANRLRNWRDIVSTDPVLEDPEVLGGRQAEHFLHTLVESHFNFQGATLYPNKRVPARDHRREIDLIIISAKMIHIVEVKNWSGTLKVVGNAWVQTNRDGVDIEHPDLVSEHQEKITVFLNYLSREGVSLDQRARAKYLSAKVIFMNRRLTILDRAIYDHPDVLLPHRLDKYLSQQRRTSFGESLLGSLVQWCLDTETAELVMDGFGCLTFDKIKAIRTAIDKLGTWDAVRYLGTRIEIGDIIEISIGGETIRRNRLPARCRIPFRWTRNRTLGLLKVFTGLGELGWVDLPGIGSRSLSPTDTIFFHKAGEPSPVQLPLIGVEELTVG